MRAAATSTAISLLSPYRFRTSAPASLPYRPEAARSPAAVEPPAPPLSKFKVALCQLLVTADKARNIGGMAAMARRGAALALAMARRGAALALAMARRGMCSASAPAGEHAAATLSSEELIRMEQDCSVHKYGDCFASRSAPSSPPPRTPSACVNVSVPNSVVSIISPTVCSSSALRLHIAPAVPQVE